MTIAALAVATSCGKSDTPTAASGPVDVRLVVSSGNNTRVGSDAKDNDIRQLRVYAFNADGEKVGYAEADNLQGQNYILPITLSKGGDINFYVIANDNFGPKPKVGTTSVTDWTSLSKANLESLKFDLSEFGGWGDKDDFVSPMSNNLKDEFGNDLENNNAYSSNPVTVTKPTVIPVTVQHVLGRLRLMLNKDASAKDVTIKVTKAVVYHRPDAFKLYFAENEKNQIDDIITFTNNAESLTEQLIDTSNAVTLDVKPDDGYTTIARTYLAPNQYGTYDKTGGKFTTEGGDETEVGKDKAYRLELTVEFTYNTTGTEIKKDYTVYLPRVPRNTSIDVQGTFKGTVVDIKPTFNIMVNAWVERTIDIPPFL